MNGCVFVAHTLMMLVASTCVTGVDLVVGVVWIPHKQDILKSGREKRTFETTVVVVWRVAVAVTVVVSVAAPIQLHAD